MTKEDICTAGLKDYYTGAPGPINDRRFADELPPLEMVDLCRSFIREKMEPAIKRGNSSYHMKHECERWTGRYITNGAFILAALLEGITQEPTGPRSPNTWIYAKKNYKQIERRQEVIV